MPLDKVLLSHLEKQDVLEDGVEQDIDSLISNLSITELMSGAEEALLALVGKLQIDLKENYYPEASKNGLELAKDIEEDGDIQVPDSNDPTLNKDLADVIEGESTT